MLTASFLLFFVQYAQNQFNYFSKEKKLMKTGVLSVRFKMHRGFPFFIDKSLYLFIIKISQRAEQIEVYNVT